MAAPAASTLHLYRAIIKAAKTFPSIKRVKILEEIRLGFRENRGLADKAKLAEALSVATKGLQQLSQYSSLPKNRSSNWSVNTEQEPMPRPPQQESIPA